MYWWSEWSWHKVLVGEPVGGVYTQQLITVFKMFDFIFLNNFDIYLSSMYEDVFVVLVMYIFIKMVLLSSVVELIWPTQIFNRKNSTNVVSFRLRTFTETILKLRGTKKSYFTLFMFI